VFVILLARNSITIRRSEQVFNLSGHGRIPVGSFLLKVAAAISRASEHYFTGYLTGESRMMIHRRVQDRLEHLTGFLRWDQDPYLVITDDGRLVWMVDGYTTSLSHPYAATLRVAGLTKAQLHFARGQALSMRTRGKYRCMYFDPNDPSFRRTSICSRNCSGLLQKCLPTSAGTPRYPEVLFARRQKPTAFFICAILKYFTTRKTFGRSAQPVRPVWAPEPVQPTYVVATVPGEKQPEFLLMLPFTPRAKDQLIGWMAARCDGEHLGDLVFFSTAEATTECTAHAD